MKNHAEMLREEFEFPPFVVSLSSVLVTESVDIDGRVVPVQVLKTVDPVKALDLNAVDFCIENQVASGNIVNLSHVMIDGSDPDALVESVKALEQRLSEQKTVEQKTEEQKTE